nr:hypothetical protein Iba_chr05cCG12100 [Ipomoea batatas]
MQARSIRTKTSTDLRTGRDVMVEGGIEELRAARMGEMDKFLIKKESVAERRVDAAEVIRSSSTPVEEISKLTLCCGFNKVEKV